MQWTSQAFDVLLERDIANPLAPQSMFTIREEMERRNGPKTDEEVASKNSRGRILCSAKIR